MKRVQNLFLRRNLRGTKICLSHDLKFVCILSFSQLSVVELLRLKEGGSLNFDLLKYSEASAAISCEKEMARRIASTAGGIFKVGRVCGKTIEDLAKNLPLPDDPKFNWTISSYSCEDEIIDEAKDSVTDFLKESGLRKARFLIPDRSPSRSEVKLSDLSKNVLTAGKDNNARGLDIIVDCTLGEICYGFTEFASDTASFHERDFGRPYQNPTLTISPRLARTLVNLCGLPKGKTILDPFCGLGTILQEALGQGYNVVGVEISSSEAAKCRQNLNWFRNRFGISPKLSSSVIRGDALKIESSDLQKIDAIATEPILVPKLERNPTSGRAKEITSNVTGKYQEAFRSFSRILRSGGFVSIVAPEIIDDRGKSHEVDLGQLAKDWGFAKMSWKEATIQNPFPVATAKKKIVQRKVYLMVKAGSKAD